jgi:hypothetical protein
MLLHITQIYRFPNVLIIKYCNSIANWNVGIIYRCRTVLQYSLQVITFINGMRFSSKFFFLFHCSDSWARFLCFTAPILCVPLLPPPQAIQPEMSMPVRRFEFEIWDEGLRSCKACWITCRLLGFWCRLFGQISSKIWHIVCQSLAIPFCEYFLNTSWQLWLIKATRRFK